MNYNSYNSNQCCIFEPNIPQKQEDRKMDRIASEDNQHTQNAILVQNQDILEQDIFRKKQQSKQKYRKLKEKLTKLCNILLEQSQTRISKQPTSQSKSRLLALAIQFQKLILNNCKDYTALQIKLRQIMKILQLKRETDILILKNSKFLSAISCLLSKIPTLYKNQFVSSLRTVELGLKILQIFCTISYNRQYVIGNNMLIVLHNCLGVLIQKQERKLSIEFLKVITELISGHHSYDVDQIVYLSLQIITMSQFAKKLKQGLQSCLPQKIIEQQFILRTLRYQYYFQLKLLQKNKDKPIYQQTQIFPPIKIYTQSLLIVLFKLLSKCLLQNQLIDLQCEQVPTILINISFYIVKYINLCTVCNMEVVNKYVRARDNAEEKEKGKEKENMFIRSLLFLFRYSKQSIENGQSNNQIQTIYSQIMILVAKLCCYTPQNRQFFNTAGFIQLIYDHPILYFMNSELKIILMPCLCAVMMNSPTNIKKYINDNSTDNLISYLKIQKKVYEDRKVKICEQPCNYVENGQNQTQQPPVRIVRKLSQSSLKSHTTQGTVSSHQCNTVTNLMQDKQKQLNRLLVYLPYESWQILISQLIELQ